ncbi:hypothetical protein D3C80_466310 [compost metagenome]
MHGLRLEFVRQDFPQRENYALGVHRVGVFVIANVDRIDFAPLAQFISGRAENGRRDFAVSGLQCWVSGVFQLFKNVHVIASNLNVVGVLGRELFRAPLRDIYCCGSSISFCAQMDLNTSKLTPLRTD